jgi:hypothetical protein
MRYKWQNFVELLLPETFMVDEPLPNHITIIKIEHRKKLAPEVFDKFAQGAKEVCKNNGLPFPLVVTETPYNKSAVVNYVYEGEPELPSIPDKWAFISIETGTQWTGDDNLSRDSRTKIKKEFNNMAKKVLGTDYTIVIKITDLDVKNCAIDGKEYHSTKKPTLKPAP